MRGELIYDKSFARRRTEKQNRRYLHGNRRTASTNKYDYLLRRFRR